jgi:O-methyltransferase
MEIPGHGLVGGEWDLRGSEEAYLGNVELAGRRVLEIGPASGFLTFYMESRGAEVVAVELGPDAEWDVVPNPRLDLDRIQADRRAVMERLRNAFWFAHERLGSRANVHYGSAYAIPAGLGRFDLAVMGSVLLHVRDPLRVVEQCARLADAVVVTDLHVPELDGTPTAQFVPAPDSDQWDTWWRMSPELVVRFLAVLGFGEMAVSHHEQLHIAAGQEYPMPMFTVVAR